MPGHTTMNEATSSQVGFSRVIAPPSMNGGFSRLNYELQGHDMQGKTTRKIKRWFKRNAPLSYIAAAVGGLIIIDAATGGAVKEIVFPRAKKRR